MIHLLIPYDNKDFSRGEYFSLSQKDLINKITGIQNLEYQLLDTEICLTQSIDNYTKNFEGSSFIIVSYLHGSEDALLVNDKPYISNQNAYLFGETLFYACSCLSAKTLGKNLVDNHCRIFLGFNAQISSLRNETENIFYHCENAFIAHFLTTEKTVQECLDYMYEEYERMKVHLTTYYGLFDASILESNLNAFEILFSDKGNLQLTKTDFINN